MDYEAACELVLTPEEARAEIQEHDCEGWPAFLEDVGEKEEYTGQEILDWLGF